MSFDDLINKSRGERSASVKDPATVIDRARATLDAALGQTGWSAAMALASHGVRPVAVGHIKRRLGFDYPEQTSHAWEVQRGLFLLRDGTWWHAQTSTAPMATEPPPAIRWAISGDSRSLPGILELNSQLTGAVLQTTDATYDDAPTGSFTVASERGVEVTYQFWVVDGVAKVADSTDPQLAVPFEE